MKKPKLKRDWEGLKVKTLTGLVNGWFSIPAGAVCTVKRNYGGLHLRSDPCPRCGMRVSISRVPEGDVEILERVEQLPAVFANTLVKNLFSLFSPNAIWSLLRSLPSGVFGKWVHSLSDEDYETFRGLFFTKEVREVLQKALEDEPANTSWEDWISDVGASLDGDPLEIVPEKYHSALKFMAFLGFDPEGVGTYIEEFVDSGNWGRLDWMTAER